MKHKNLGLAEFSHYTDLPGDPIFYHPRINTIKVWAQFEVLIPEDYGWIVVGSL
jgi:hypothetical protein